MPDEQPTVHIAKLVEGGQGLGELPDGKKVFVWNALPGEMVRARIIKQKHSFAEAIAEEVLTVSPERIEPLETNYLATSPWQIMDFAAENKYKKQIVEDIFSQAKVDLPATFELTAVREEQERPREVGSGFTPKATMRNPLAGVSWGYRGKMEYSFWGDDDGLHLALHMRGSHGKQIVSGSKLAMPEIDKAANAVLTQLHKLSIRAGDLKTIIVRSSQAGSTVAALYVKVQEFPKLELPEGMQGLRVYYSNPKSPASVRTKLLQEVGDCALHDTLLGKSFTYDVDSFFQVNMPIFEQALIRIKEHCTEPEIVDMYAGVGSIGLSVASKAVDLIELDPATVAMAHVNAKASGLAANVVEASTEKVLDYIRGDRPIIFDPPRAGLHDKVVSKVLEVQPPRIVYLSCNPVTQARDLAKLQETYTITYFEAFNFFPRTPHTETLAILERKN